MKKKLSLDKELIASTENIVVDAGTGTFSVVTCLSCYLTACESYCMPTPCTCSVETL